MSYFIGVKEEFVAAMLGNQEQGSEISDSANLELHKSVLSVRNQFVELSSLKQKAA